MLKILGLAARGEAGFSGFLPATASWIAAELLSGCAAYAEAMYPLALQPPDRFDPEDEQKPDIEDSKQAKIHRHSRRSSCMTLLESPALPGVSFRKCGRRIG
jgi:hypothetical protein